MRRGVKVPTENEPDHLDRIPVHADCSRHVVTLPASQTLARTHAWLLGGHPDAATRATSVLDDAGHVIGLPTRRDLLGAGRGGDVTLGSMVTRLR